MPGIKQLHVDKISLNMDAFEIGPEGFLTIDAQITRTGVFEYRNPITGDIRLELRHPDDVFQQFSMDSLKLKPITNDHPVEMVSSENAKQLQVGSIGEMIRPDGQFMVAPITVTDETTIQQIRDGKRELSAGYFALTIEDEGIYVDGEGNHIPHTHRQTLISYNHLAVVDVGRAGPAVRIPAFDSADASPEYQGYHIQEKRVTDSETGKQSRKDSRMPVKIIINDSDYEVPNEVKVYVDKLEANLATAKTDQAGISVVVVGDASMKMDAAAKKLLDSLQGKVDTQDEKIEELKKIDHTIEINAGVRRRAQILTIADTVLPKPEGDQKKHDEASNSDLQKAIVLALTHEDKREAKKAKLDHADTSQDYLDTVFDTMIDMVPTRDPKAIADQAAAIAAGNNGNAIVDEDDPDVARAAMEKRDEERSQPEKKGS